MRFPTKFSRFKTVIPAGGKVLGSDTVPAKGTTPDTTTLDNMISHKFSNVNGWPCHRLAVVYNYKGGGAAIDLTATMYVYEANTARWYRLGLAGVTLHEGVVTFFDTVGLIELGATDANLAAPVTGSEQALLIVADPGAAPDGEHEFAIGPDLTTIGY